MRAWVTAVLLAVSHASAPVEVSWDGIPPPIQRMLSARGVDRTTLAAHIGEVRRSNLARLREGDLDHLVYYVLQSTAFTNLPPIEPAVSARASGSDVPRDVLARVDAFVKVVARPGGNARMAYIREILEREKPASIAAHAFVRDQYARAMRFFTEPKYQERGLSSDTSVDAGYVLYLALAALRELEPKRSIRSVLIVGPGLDLAPRTRLVDASEPHSHQPFVVMDALVGVGLANRDSLSVTAVDINPRVVAWLKRTRGTAARLTVLSGIAPNARVRLSDDYRDYFASLGKAVATAQPLTLSDGRLAKALLLPAAITSAIDATLMDIVTEQLDRRFDLVVVTNVFPYLSDSDLLLACSNIAAMLAPGGVLLHNEPRALLAEAAAALRLALIHSRSAVIANVDGAESPFYDAVWMHRAPD
jgi:hypothetical protein